MVCVKIRLDSGNKDLSSKTVSNTLEPQEPPNVDLSDSSMNTLDENISDSELGDHLNWNALTNQLGLVHPQ